MAQWLYSLIKKDDQDRAPDFARQSHINWARALSHEVLQEHGDTALAQWESVQDHFGGTVKPRRMTETSLVDIFEPLFASMQFATSLVSMASRGEADPWECPGATITWYYATYNAFRAMLAACNQLPQDTHAAAVRALNGGLRPLLPHPFDMVATRGGGEEYDDRLPRHPRIQRTRGGFAAINGAFVEDRPVAQRMLLEYLHGTAAYWTWHTKEKILAKGVYANFKTKAARDERDRQLRSEVNFLDCAYRYCGKANYRDAIFLSYGQAHAGVGLPFVRDLARTARFATLTAVAYVNRRVGPNIADAFAGDLRDNFAGRETFWRDVP
jgi:hypothetical protein